MRATTLLQGRWVPSKKLPVLSCTLLPLWMGQRQQNSLFRPGLFLLLTIRMLSPWQTGSGQTRMWTFYSSNHSKVVSKKHFVSTWSDSSDESVLSKKVMCSFLVPTYFKHIIKLHFLDNRPTINTSAQQCEMPSAWATWVCRRRMKCCCRRGRRPQTGCRQRCGRPQTRQRRQTRRWSWCCYTCFQQLNTVVVLSVVSFNAFRSLFSYFGKRTRDEKSQESRLVTNDSLGQFLERESESWVIKWWLESLMTQFITWFKSKFHTLRMFKMT